MEKRRHVESEKCNLFPEKIDYLGHATGFLVRLNLAYLTADENQDLKPSQTVTDLESFSGLCNENRRVVPNSKRIVAPLNAKPRKEEPIQLIHLYNEGIDAVITLQQNPSGRKSARIASLQSGN